MNCSQVRDHLPFLVYGDCDAAQAARLEEHLAGCDDCRKEHATLKNLRLLLDTVPAPEIQVDLALLYGQAAKRQERQLRTWRRATFAALAAAAAIILVVLALRLEIRVDRQQMVIRWGLPPVQQGALPARAIQTEASPITPSELQLVANREELRQLRQLIPVVHDLKTDAEYHSLQQQREIAELKSALHQLRKQSVRTNERLAETEKGFAALYADRFLLTKKGPPHED